MTFCGELTEGDVLLPDYLSGYRQAAQVLAQIRSILAEGLTDATVLDASDVYQVLENEALESFTANQGLPDMTPLSPKVVVESLVVPSGCQVGGFVEPTLNGLVALVSARQSDRWSTDRQRIDVLHQNVLDQIMPRFIAGLTVEEMVRRVVVSQRVIDAEVKAAFNTHDASGHPYAGLVRWWLDCYLLGRLAGGMYMPIGMAGIPVDTFGNYLYPPGWRGIQALLGGHGDHAIEDLAPVNSFTRFVIPLYAALGLAHSKLVQSSAIPVKRIAQEYGSRTVCGVGTMIPTPDAKRMGEIESTIYQQFGPWRSSSRPTNRMRAQALARSRESQGIERRMAAARS
jgi:hypothetical protein